jgi:hypothetical protein
MVFLFNTSEGSRSEGYSEVSKKTLDFKEHSLEEKKSLFREFKVKAPYQSVKDIFCLRANRTIDAYRRILINNLQLKVNNVAPRDIITLRIHPMDNGVSEGDFSATISLSMFKGLKIVT